MTRYLILGAGAIGGVVGARLAESGRDVVLVARGDHAASMARDGLPLDAPDGSITGHLPVIEDLGLLDVRAGDVALLCVKSQSTEGVVRRLAEIAPPDLPVVCLQNGVSNEARVASCFEQTYGAVVMCPATHLEPGVVVAHSAPLAGVIDVGCYPEGTDDRCDQLAGDLSTAGFGSRAVPDIMRWKYAKLLLNLTNVLDALLEDSGSGRLVGLVYEEGRQVLEAAGIEYASPDEDASRRDGRVSIVVGRGRRREGGSTWQSVARGASETEVPYLNGAIVELGRTVGVATPVNELIVGLDREALTSGRGPRSYCEVDVLARLDPSVTFGR